MGWTINVAPPSERQIVNAFILVNQTSQQEGPEKELAMCPTRWTPEEIAMPPYGKALAPPSVIFDLMVNAVALSNA